MSSWTVIKTRTIYKSVPQLFLCVAVCGCRCGFRQGSISAAVLSSTEHLFPAICQNSGFNSHPLCTPASLNREKTFLHKPIFGYIFPALHALHRQDLSMS